MTAPNITSTVTFIGTTPVYDTWTSTGITFQPNQTYLVTTQQATLLLAQTSYFIDGSLRNGIGYTAGQLQGNKTSDSAVAGDIGELKTASLASASATSLTTDTIASVTSVILTPGRWMVTGVVGYKAGATTSTTRLLAAISTTSTALDGLGTYSQIVTAAQVPGNTSDNILPAPSVPVSVAAGATTTIYLLAEGTFTVSTLAAYGNIQAIRTS